jgi:hypothetical protein
MMMKANMSMQLRARVRLALLVLSIPVIALLGITIFESAHPFAIVDNLQQNNILLQLLPSWFVVLLVPLTEWQYVRYVLAPLGAFLLAFLAGALFVQDVYALETFSSASRYIFSSMFGLFYPSLKIDGGDKSVSVGKINTLIKVGGPGYLFIRPGNAVILQNQVPPPSIRFSGRYFLRPFEMIGASVDLNEQEGYRDEVWAVTLDGIQLHLRDVRFRYRLLLNHVSGDIQGRSTNDPYPISQDAIFDSIFNLSAGDTWKTAVQRLVIGEITDFISGHTIDYLTAPRKVGWNPRFEMRKQLFMPGLQQRLNRIGTELLWVDVGQFDIIELTDNKHENVDGTRLEYWASHWAATIKRIHALADAKRMAYQERGRVEAQAAFLQSITDAFRGIKLSEDPAENLRRILLVRTAEILEGMAEPQEEKENRHD